MSDRPAMIVTGASSGIGRALAERAARSGYDVFAVGRRHERLRELVRAVEFATGNVEFLAIDLQTPHAAKRIVGEALARFGRIDVLVNCAGGTAVGALGAQTDAQLREQFETHAVVPLALTREALPQLRAAKGHVFFFGSGVARIPVAGLGAYPPAKASVRSLSRIVRNELRADGIAVTYVDPGAVATEFMTRAGFSGPPPFLAAKANDVASKIFDAVRTRRPVVNAVPWQTFFVALGEALPGVTDTVLRLAPGIVGTAGGAKKAERKSVSASPITRLDGTPLTADGQAATSGAPPDRREPASAAASTTPPSTMHPPAPPSSAPPADAQPAPVPVPVPAPAPPPPVAEKTGPELALEAVAPRMRKLNLSTAFVHSLLVEGRELELGDVAMRWAGMPNKNERNLTREVLEALANAGYLTRESTDRYRVARGAAE